MFKKALKSVSGVEDARKKKKIQGPRQFESEEKKTNLHTHWSL